MAGGRLRRIVLAAAALAMAGAAQAQSTAIRLIQPLPRTIVGAAHVVAVDVAIAPAAAAMIARFERRAAERRTAAGLPPVDPAAAPEARPSPADYATLPLVQLLPLEIADAARDWGLTGGQAVRLKVTVDMMKTLDVGRALLLGSADELTGTVVVLDPLTGATLGKFVVFADKRRTGWIGLAMRGGDVRETLAAIFARHVAEELSGRMTRPKSRP